MQLNENQKFHVMLAELQERYQASHKIRERSIQFTLWISGMAIGLGWLLISQANLMISQRFALKLIILALFAGTLYFIWSLRSGFNNNRNTLIRCEKVLGLYDANLYMKGFSILPSEYRGTKIKWNDHFCTLCVWLIIVAVALLILTWSPAHSDRQLNSQTKIEQMKKEGKSNG